MPLTKNQPVRRVSLRGVKRRRQSRMSSHLVRESRLLRAGAVAMTFRSTSRSQTELKAQSIKKSPSPGKHPRVFPLVISFSSGQARLGLPVKLLRQNAQRLSMLRAFQQAGQRIEEKSGCLTPDTRAQIDKEWL